MTHQPLSPWSRPPTETRLTPKRRAAKPWRRQYRLRDVGGNHRGSVVIASEDAPADDPDTRRFWRWVVVLFCVLVATGAFTAAYDLLT